MAKNYVTVPVTFNIAVETDNTLLGDAEAVKVASAEVERITDLIREAGATDVRVKTMRRRRIADEAGEEPVADAA